MTIIEEWDNEPESDDFVFCGLSCKMIRGPWGSWCGYVSVSEDHPWHGVMYYENDSKIQASPPESVIEVHGGLTFSGVNTLLSDDKKSWWFGFDCSHYGDFAPKLDSGIGGIYRNHQYVKNETESMAKQLLEIK